MWLPVSSADEVCAGAEKVRSGPDRVALILLPEKGGINLPELIEKLNRRKIHFAGGIFPRLIHGNQVLEDGVILLDIPIRCKPVLIKDLPGRSGRIMELDGAPKLTRRDTVCVLVDGLTSNINSFLAGLSEALGPEAHFFGGGGGSCSMTPMPCLFTSEGVFQDAALLLIMPMESLLGVRHGWTKLCGPFVATRARCNIIDELDGRGAFEVYKEAVDRDCRVALTPANFAALGATYPFGIIIEKGERVVRDPFRVTSEGGLVCCGEVPENARLEIMKGEPNALIKIAAEAARDCLSPHPFMFKSVLIADCVSRLMFLKDRYKEELMAVSRVQHRQAPGVIPEGMLTIGEIASHGDGRIDFFNKTIVVCAIGDK